MDWLYSITVKGMASSEKNIIKCTSKWSEYIPTIPHKNIETNDKFYRKVAFLMYTEMVKFRSQSRETASKRKPYRGLGTR